MTPLLAQAIWWDPGVIASLAVAWELANRARLKTVRTSQLKALLSQGQDATSPDEYHRHLSAWLYRIEQGETVPREGAKPRWKSRTLIEATLEAVRIASEEQGAGLALELRRFLDDMPEQRESVLTAVRLRQARSFVATAVQLALSTRALELKSCRHLLN